MTTRAKLILCVGLVGLAAGVALVWSRPAPRPVQLSFVRYASDGTAVLGFTNWGSHPIFVLDNPMEVALETKREGQALAMPLNAFSIFAEHEGVEVMAAPRAWPDPTPRLATLPGSISVGWQAMPSRSRWRRPAEALLEKVGFITANTGGVATVTLPPK